jgi:hypothetical protein
MRGIIDRLQANDLKAMRNLVWSMISTLSPSGPSQIVR